MNNNTMNTKKTAQQTANEKAVIRFKQEQLKSYGVKTQKELTAEQKKEFEAKVLSFKANLTATAEKTAEQKTEKKAGKQTEQKKEKKTEQKTEKKADTFNKKAELKKLETELKKRLAGAELSVTETKAKILVKKSGKSVFKCFIQKAGIRVYTDEQTAKKAKIKAEKKSDSYQFAYTAIATLEQIEKLYTVAEVKQKKAEDKKQKESK